MAIVLIRQDGKLDLWKNALLGQYPDLPVFHYKEPHPTEKVTMAIVWKHPEGSLTQLSQFTMHSLFWGWCRFYL